MGWNLTADMITYYLVSKCAQAKIEMTIVIEYVNDWRY